MTTTINGSSPSITFSDSTTQATAAPYGPAFSAYSTATQTVTANTFTKLQANVKEFDTASCYDNTTNYRFTPNVAGYYQVTCQVNPSSTTSVTRTLPALYKNGTVFKYGVDVNTATAGRSQVSALVYLNGTTDYIEYYFLLNGVGTLSVASGGAVDSFFQAALVRAA
jgi:hypothetical protein